MPPLRNKTLGDKSPQSTAAPEDQCLGFRRSIHPSIVQACGGASCCLPSLLLRGMETDLPVPLALPARPRGLAMVVRPEAPNGPQQTSPPWRTITIGCTCSHKAVTGHPQHPCEVCRLRGSLQVTNCQPRETVPLHHFRDLRGEAGW